MFEWILSLIGIKQQMPRKLQNVTEKSIQKALRKLGRTPDAVAKTLTRMKITGYRSNTFCCPIANYLRKILPAGSIVMVMVNSSSISCNLGTLIIIKAPPAVSKFILAFDTQGCYPQLRNDNHLNIDSEFLPPA